MSLAAKGKLNINLIKCESKSLQKAFNKRTDKTYQNLDGNRRIIFAVSTRKYKNISSSSQHNHHHPHLNSHLSHSEPLSLSSSIQSESSSGSSASAFNQPEPEPQPEPETDGIQAEPLKPGDSLSSSVSLSSLSSSSSFSSGPRKAKVWSSSKKKKNSSSTVRNSSFEKEEIIIDNPNLSLTESQLEGSAQTTDKGLGPGKTQGLGISLGTNMQVNSKYGSSESLCVIEKDALGNITHKMLSPSIHSLQQAQAQAQAQALSALAHKNFNSIILDSDDNTCYYHGSVVGHLKFLNNQGEHQILFSQTPINSLSPSTSNDSDYSLSGPSPSPSPIPNSNVNPSPFGKGLVNSSSSSSSNVISPLVQAHLNRSPFVIPSSPSKNRNETCLQKLPQLREHFNGLEIYYVTNSNQLRELVEIIRISLSSLEEYEESSIAVDTEFIDQNFYSRKPCLIQIATTKLFALIDVILLKQNFVSTNGDISSDSFSSNEPPSASASASNSDGLKEFLEFLFQRKLIFHSHQGDVTLLYQLAKEYNLEIKFPRQVMDTQIAAAFLGLGQQLSYVNLISLILPSHSVLKNESLSDWSMRPLSVSQIFYAIDDVRYLHQIHKLLRTKLIETGRDVAYLWEIQNILFDSIRQFDSQHFHGVKVYNPNTKKISWRMDENTINAWRLINRGPEKFLSASIQLSVLQYLAQWREECAYVEDKPTHFILKNETLVAIAAALPQSVMDLERIQGLSYKFIRTYSHDILSLVRRGRNSKMDERPLHLFTNKQNGRLNKEMASFIYGVISALSSKYKIPSYLIASREEIEELASIHPFTYGMIFIDKFKEYNLLENMYNEKLSKFASNDKIDNNLILNYFYDFSDSPTDTFLFPSSIKNENINKGSDTPSSLSALSASFPSDSKSNPYSSLANTIHSSVYLTPPPVDFELERKVLLSLSVLSGWRLKIVGFYFIFLFSKAAKQLLSSPVTIQHFSQVHLIHSETFEMHLSKAERLFLQPHQGNSNSPGPFEQIFLALANSIASKSLSKG